MVADVLEVAHDDGHEVGAHFDAGLVVVLQQTGAVRGRALQRHVEEGDVSRFTDDRQAEVGLQVWLVEAREGGSGIRRLKVSGCDVPRWWWWGWWWWWW